MKPLTSRARRWGLRALAGGAALATVTVLGAHGAGPAPSAGVTSAAAHVAAAAPRTADSPSITFRIGSFNALGAWHTRAYHDASNYLPGPMRAHLAAEVIRVYNPGVVGLQEPELDQIPVMAAELPDYDFWPGNSLGDPGVRNTIAWDNRRFAKTAQGHLDLMFLGLHRYDSFVRLQDRATGRQFWVMDVHNSPKRGDDSQTSKERATQLAAEATEIRKLEATGLPVLLVGDFNDKQYTYCYLVSHTQLRAVQGYPGGCTLPNYSHIEWIFGTHGRVSWSNYKYDHGPLIATVTDHHIPWVTVTLP